MDKRGTSPRSTEPLKPARPVTRVFHDLSGWPSRLIPFKDVYDMFCPKETLAMFHHSGSPVHTHVHIYCICIQYTLVKLPKLWAPVTSRWNPPIFYLDHDHCLNLSSEGKLNWLLSSNVNRINDGWRINVKKTIICMKYMFQKPEALWVDSQHVKCKSTIRIFGILVPPKKLPLQWADLNVSYVNKNTHQITGWWFQPIWKILVKMEIFPK